MFTDGTVASPEVSIMKYIPSSNRWMIVNHPTQIAPGQVNNPENIPLGRYCFADAGTYGSTPVVDEDSLMTFPGGDIVGLVVYPGVCPDESNRTIVAEPAVIPEKPADWCNTARRVIWVGQPYL